MVDKVNGSAKAGEFLGKQLDFYSATMDVAGADAAAVKKAVEKAIETISINGQPIMLSGTALAAAAAATGLTLKFAIEHTGSWGQDGDNGALVADKTQDATTTLAAAFNSIVGVSNAAVTLVNSL